MILGIRGSKAEGVRIIEYLKLLGGFDHYKLQGTDESYIYYIDPVTGYIDTHSLIVFDHNDIEELKKFYKVTYEDLIKQFPYKMDQVVLVTKPDETGNVIPAYGHIINMIWDSNIDEILYDVSFGLDHCIYEVDAITRIDIPADSKLATCGYKFNNQTPRKLTVHPDKELEIHFDPEEYDAIIRNGKIIIVKKV